MSAIIAFAKMEKELHRAASEATGGLEDFGDDSYLAGLRALLEAFDRDGARFTSAGREFVTRLLVGVLIARLLTEEGWKENPDCLKQAISRPLVITGVPRTGTTALHKLLAVDPQFQGLDRWLTAFPMPRPPRESWPQNPWYRTCVQGLEAFFASAPDMRAAHDMRADDVDECLEVLKQDFCSNFYGSSIRVPAYDDWWLRQSEAASYHRYVKVLKLIGAGGPGRTWLLKNPGHVATLDLLLDVLPDARVVQTHRDPVKAIPSLCSVLRQARAIVAGNAVDGREIGRRELDYWARAVERADNVRSRSPGQFIDIRQDELHRDPMSVIDRIYDGCGLDMSDEVRAAMVERIGRSPERSQGKHVYSLDEFGLSKAEIERRFGDYIGKYLSD